MVATGFLALLLLGIPIVLAIVVGVALLVASRRTRAAGMLVLAVVGVLVLVPALLVWLWVSGEEQYVATPEIPRPFKSPDWIAAEDEIVPAVAADEAMSTSSVSDVDAATDESAGGPADAETVETSVEEPLGVTVEAPPFVESETAEGESAPNSKSPTEAISRALMRAIGESSSATDDTSKNVSHSAETTSDRSTLDTSLIEDAVGEAVDTPEVSESTDVVADIRPADANAAEVAEIKRYLDRAEPTERIVSDVDPLSAGAVIPSEAPPWIKLASFEVDGTDYRPVASGPYATRDECRLALAEAMKRAVDEYVNEYHGQPQAAKYVDIDLAYIKTHLRRGDVYQERLQASFGPMIQQHALLEFRQDFRDEIERRWNQVKVTSRLGQVGLAAAAILAGLATILVYLRLDTATKGYYSGRLQIAAGAVILGLVALGVLTARWIPWL